MSSDEQREWNDTPGELPMARLFCPRCEAELQNTHREYRCHVCLWRAPDRLQPHAVPPTAPAPVTVNPWHGIVPYATATGKTPPATATSGVLTPYVERTCPIHGPYWSLDGRCPQADAGGGCSR